MKRVVGYNRFIYIYYLFVASVQKCKRTFDYILYCTLKVYYFEKKLLVEQAYVMIKLPTHNQFSELSNFPTHRIITVYIYIYTCECGQQFIVRPLYTTHSLENVKVPFSRFDCIPHIEEYIAVYRI